MPTSAIGTRRPSPSAEPVGGRPELELRAIDMHPSTRTRRRAGFTLLELMATVAVMMVMLGLVVPGLGATRSAKLRSEARDLASRLELARQLAVMTGRPHRVLIDIDRSAYRVDWLASENEARGEEPEAPSPLDLTGETPIPLSPPTRDRLQFYPVSNRFGSNSYLDSTLFFAGVLTDEGWLDRGEVGVMFESDGTTDPAEIVIADSGDRQITLEVRPLLDVVRVRDD